MAILHRGTPTSICFQIKEAKASSWWLSERDESNSRSIGMRRSLASNLVSSGVSIYTVAKWLGDRVDVVEKSYGYLGAERWRDQQGGVTD